MRGTFFVHFFGIFSSIFAAVIDEQVLFRYNEGW